MQLLIVKVKCIFLGLIFCRCRSFIFIGSRSVFTKLKVKFEILGFFTLSLGCLSLVNQTLTDLLGQESVRKIFGLVVLHVNLTVVLDQALSVVFHFQVEKLRLFFVDVV